MIHSICDYCDGFGIDFSAELQDEDCTYCNGHGEVCARCYDSCDDCVCGHEEVELINIGGK